MTCIKCSKPLQPDFVFCPYCGKKQVVEKKYRKRANHTGTIYKRQGNLEKPWLAKKNNIYLGYYKTRTEAQKALERITDIDITDSYNMTFAQVYERWYGVHAREISESMQKGYQLAYSQCPQLHDRMIRKILRSDYQNAIIALENQGKSKSSCNKLRALFSQLGRWAMEEGITLTNPAEELTTVAKQLTVRDTFTEAEIDAIRKSGHPAADVALILIASGCRPGELFSVPVDNCWDDHFIGGSKTEAGRNRVIPIGPDGIEAYRRMREEAIKQKKPLLIDGYTGKNRTAPNYTKRDWRELMDLLKIEGMTPYNCRHTFITRAIRSGMELAKLEAIVGHVDRETTKIYTHMNAQDLVDAVQTQNQTALSVVTTLSHRPETASSKSRKKFG